MSRSALPDIVATSHMRLFNLKFKIHSHTSYISNIESQMWPVATILDSIDTEHFPSSYKVLLDSASLRSVEEVVRY